jgi:hypothetical protein
LGGGKNSLFFATHQNQKETKKLDSVMKKLQNMEMDEELEDKLIAFKYLLGKMDKFRRS